MHELRLGGVVVGILLHPGSACLGQSFLVSGTSTETSFGSPVSYARMGFFVFSVVGSLLCSLSFGYLLFAICDSLLRACCRLIYPFPSVARLCRIVSSGPVKPHTYGF